MRGEVRVASNKVWAGTFTDAWNAGIMPRWVLICSNTDQILDYISEWIDLIVLQNEQNLLFPSASEVPALVLTANGIYFQRVRQILIEKLEEAELLGKLPDLWPDVMPKVVSRLIRGVTMQTSVRHGEGADAIYCPGPSNITTLAGGDRGLRRGICADATRRGARFEDAGELPPTRVEFQKAFMNLNSNLLGLISAISSDGSFRPLTLKEIYTADFCIRGAELIRHVLSIGKAVHAFAPEESAEPIIAHVFEVAQRFPDHVPSSIQWIEQQVRHGNISNEIPPTEKWLLSPLLHYAKNAGLKKEHDFLEALQQQLQQKLTLAKTHYDTKHTPGARAPSPSSSEDASQS